MRAPKERKTLTLPFGLKLLAGSLAGRLAADSGFDDIGSGIPVPWVFRCVSLGILHRALHVCVLQAGGWAVAEVMF